MGVYLPFSLLWFVRLVRVLGPAFAGLGERVSTVLKELDFEGRTQQRWRSRGAFVRGEEGFIVVKKWGLKERRMEAWQKGKKNCYHFKGNIWPNNLADLA
jgi:hypothetical protein